MFLSFILVFFLIVFLLLISLLGICWYFSSRLLDRRSRPAQVLVTHLDTETVTLQRTKNTMRPGVYGIGGMNGQAIVGPVLSSDAKSVKRQLIKSLGDISPQSKIAWNTTIYGGKLREQLLPAICDISIPGALGDMPAWFVPGQCDTWAILVHGSTGTREQGLRVFQTLADLGLPILAIMYRNDAGAPSSTDGLSHLGSSEWEDVEASVTYAFAHGAQRIVLYGWSMGGTIVEMFLRQSSHAKTVQAVVLDSPVLSWRATLESLAKKNRLPSFIARMTEKVVERRTGIYFNTLDLMREMQARVPTLLFHGTSDSTAPLTISEAFASAHSKIRYHQVPLAEHTQCWNVDPEKYEVQLRSFLKDILDVRELSTHSSDQSK